MAASLSIDDASKVVIKLRLLADGQVRRIPVTRILSPSSSKPSYATFRSIAVKFVFPEVDGDSDDTERLYDVVIQYVDVDGDTITVSTDEELEEALGQLLESQQVPLVLRASAEVRKRDDVIDSPASQHSGEKPHTENKDSPKRPSPPRSERCLASGRIGDLAWDLLSTNEGIMSEEAGEVAESIAQDIVSSISLMGGTGSVITEGTENEDFSAQSARSVKEDRTKRDGKDQNKSFVHAFHTCDGCGVCPIVGMRYHATNQKDYDLCARCFDLGKGVNGFDFVPEELERDRLLQTYYAAADTANAVAEQLASDVVASIALQDSDEAESGKDNRKEETTEGPGSGNDKKGLTELKEETTEEDKPDEASAPFIHRRHTCDGCGIGPIIGTRYRSTDCVNYDLCEGCYRTGKGVGDRKFAPEELECDRRLQLRWARRGYGHCGFPVRRGCPHGAFRRQWQRESRQRQHREENVRHQEAILRSTRDVQADATAKDKEQKKEGGSHYMPSAPPAEEEFMASAASWRDVAQSFSSVADSLADAVDITLATATSEIEKRASKVEEASSEAASRIRSAKARAQAQGFEKVGSVLSKVADAVAAEVKAAAEREKAKRDESKDKEKEGTASPNERNDSNAGAKEDADDLGERKKPNEPGLPFSDAVVPSSIEIDTSADSFGEEENKGEDGGKTKIDDWQVVDDVTKKPEEATKDMGDNKGVIDVNKERDEGKDIVLQASIPPPVLARWGKHLVQLHELGFLDDRKSVDVLESLQAANLGVESTDEVTVNDAVNYLLGLDE